MGPLVAGEAVGAVAPPDANQMMSSPLCTHRALLACQRVVLAVPRRQTLERHSEGESWARSLARRTLAHLSEMGQMSLASWAEPVGAGAQPLQSDKGRVAAGTCEGATCQEPTCQEATYQGACWATCWEAKRQEASAVELVAWLELEACLEVAGLAANPGPVASLEAIPWGQLPQGQDNVEAQRALVCSLSPWDSPNQIPDSPPLRLQLRIVKGIPEGDLTRTKNLWSWDSSVGLRGFQMRCFPKLHL